MGISEYFAEIMKQPYNSNLGPDYTKVAILLYLKKNGFLFSEKPIFEITRFIYRFFIDNPDYAKEMNYVMIKNINNYSPNDTFAYTQNALQEWIKNGNGIIQASSAYVSTNSNLQLSETEVENLSSMCDILIKKYYGKKIEYDDSSCDIFSNIDFSKFSPEEYLSFVNSTKFRQRAFENLNYCCCCDEAHNEKLFAVHLNMAKDINDPDNSLVFCRDHALLYIKKNFRFNNMGRIEILCKDPLLDPRMRISQQVIPFKKKFL